MKGIINMSCTSQNSATIISSNMELLSSASSSISPSCSSGPSSFTPGGRAIDRHNPIITDEKRRGSGSAPATPRANIHPIKPTTGSPKPPQQHNPKRSRKLLERRRKNSPKPTSTRDDDDDEKGKNVSKRSDLLTKAACTVARPGTNYISPPESSRYLLDESSSVIDVLSNFDPVLKLVPKNPAEIEVCKISSTLA
ncbi:hypothetical protein Cgig2_017495 [Carnegiea gigantea]|uniref:Uncharacterized protein n=1 Tax=Carnegiea gigantea TaxID=171969 RepID=A0A9Q1QKS2_9CARY|nr:hypothetical protein Cgig2_017495 [Carnegiea gigantea]